MTSRQSRIGGQTTGWGSHKQQTLRCPPVLVVLFTLTIILSSAAVAEVEYVVENYNHLLTYQDCGINQFGGNTGGVRSFVVCDPETRTHSFVTDSADGPGRSLRLAIDSLPDGEFVGIFHSLAGLIDTDVTFDGNDIVRVSFPKFTINLEDFFQEHAGEPTVTLDVLRFWTKHQRPNDDRYHIKVILKDTEDKEDARFVDVQPGHGWQQHDLLLDTFPQPGGVVDRRRLKQLVFLVERSGSGFTNPAQIDFLLDHIAFVDRDGVPDSMATLSDTDFLWLVARRTFTYFLDYVSRDPRSAGIVQDRSTFNDLLTVGGLGFSLSAFCIGDREGWLPHAEAVQRVLETLRILADDGRQSANRIGAIGYLGFFYHFLNIDGRRKLNFNRSETPENEKLNTVELSTIDTALALMGVIAVKNHFAGTSPPEREIRRLARQILHRVEWPFMLELTSQQFYLGWKPTERGRKAPPFQIPDPQGHGFYAGSLHPQVCPHEPDPATLDFYTDEALLVALLAIASPNPHHRLGKEVWDAIERKIEPGDGPFVKSFPGALFTYFFASSWIDWRFLGPDAHPTVPVDWYANNRRAIRQAVMHSKARADLTCGTLESPTAKRENTFCTYSGYPVGLTAAEGPDDKYRAYTDPTVATRRFRRCDGVSQRAFHMDDGTVAPYGVGAAILYAPNAAIQALRAYATIPGVWHPRFGFADAFNMDPALLRFRVSGNDQIDKGAFLDGQNTALSRQRPWVTPTRFAIDQGPLLLTIHNYLTQTATRPGYLQSLMMEDPDIRRALSVVYGQDTELPARWVE